LLASCVPAAAHVARAAHRVHRGKHTSVKVEVLVLVWLGWWPAVYSSVLAERVVAHVNVLLVTHAGAHVAHMGKLKG